MSGFWPHLFTFALYVTACLGLFVYSTNSYVLVFLFLRTRRKVARGNAETIAAAQRIFDAPGRLPRVTTQIPVYNEANVIEKSLRSAAAIDYPRELHEIQVLDDSTDLTRDIIDRVAGELRSLGHDIRVLRRGHRSGFKAGALAAGLDAANGQFIAIFDADFTPPSHFLRWTLPFFFEDDRLGLVQARWGHLNSSETPLTRVQAIGIDGHFMVEQSARTFGGLLMNFNGAAGLWRKRAIVEAGGWSAETLTEDLDLSYRAQLCRWRTHFVAELEVPAELPSGITALKSQQFRWAKGSIQTARKLLPRIFRSDCSFWVKLQAALHLTHYAMHPLVLVAALLAFPVIGHRYWSLPYAAAAFPLLAVALAVAAPNVLYTVSQCALYRRWWEKLLWLPMLTFVGIGIAASNTRAVIEAVIGRPSEFVRTPKRGESSARKYRPISPLHPWVEVALGLYCAASLFFCPESDRYIEPFLILYAGGFLAIGLLGLAEYLPSTKSGRS